MIDNYTLRATFYPVLLLLSPLIVIGVTYSIRFENILHFSASIGIVAVLTYFLSQVGRDQGKKKEPELWSAWGGAPTTKILRLRDQTLNQHIKERYHKKLKIVCPLSIVTDIKLEETSPSAADEVYQAWTKYLISKTRDTKLFPLVLKENTSYGFRRNLWGLKPYAISLILIMLLLQYLYYSVTFKSYDLNSFSSEYKMSSSILLSIGLIWVIFITKDWVKIPAFAYAERLCESTENL